MWGCVLRSKDKLFVEIGSPPLDSGDHIQAIRLKECLYPLRHFAGSYYIFLKSYIKHEL